MKQYKCRSSVLRNESVNSIRLKETAKLNTLHEPHNEKTSEAIKKVEKDLSMDLHLLGNEATRDVKILKAISAIESDRIDDTFYPYRPHRDHLTTRFGLLFNNNKIIIPEAIRTSIVAMLHQRHVSTRTRRQRHFGGQECTAK